MTAFNSCSDRQRKREHFLFKASQQIAGTSGEKKFGKWGYETCQGNVAVAGWRGGCEE